ncbi:MAG TPA: hypothetical protein VK658_26705 [Chryseolinea sp.]|nr:hypothetical protein [Chryseolinea sp.]
MIYFRPTHFTAVLILSCAAAPGVYGQSSAIPNNIRASYTMEGLADANAIGKNEILYGVPAPAGKVIGDTYLGTHWRKSAIQLYKDDRVVEGYPVRYDIQTDALDVKTDAGVKVLEGKRIRSFSWVDSSRLDPVFFVNARDYKFEGSPLLGFFEVLVDGKVPLFKRTELHVKKADYNVSFDVGSRDDKILKQSSYYIGQQQTVVEVSPTRKKVIALFGDKANEMEKYMSDNDVSLKKEADLVRTFQYYNSLLTQ